MQDSKVIIEVVYRARCGKHTVVTDVMSVNMGIRPEMFEDFRCRDLAYAVLAEPRDPQERGRLADRLMLAAEDAILRNQRDPE